MTVDTSRIPFDFARYEADARSSIMDRPTSGAETAQGRHSFMRSGLLGPLASLVIGFAGPLSQYRMLTAGTAQPSSSITPVLKADWLVENDWPIISGAITAEQIAHLDTLISLDLEEGLSFTLDFD